MQNVFLSKTGRPLHEKAKVLDLLLEDLDGCASGQILYAGDVRTKLREALKELIRSGFHPGHDDDCRDVGCLAIIREFQPQWRKFDKDDETTWPHPPEMHPGFHGNARGRYWTVKKDSDGTSIVEMEYWYTRPRNAVDEFWAHSVLFWMPITVPSPPESEES